MGLRTIALSPQTLENFARSHIQKLHLNLGVRLFIARHEIAQHVLAVRCVDEELVLTILIRGSATGQQTEAERQSSE